MGEGDGRRKSLKLCSPPQHFSYFDLVHKKNMLLYLLGELQRTAAEVQRLKSLLEELQTDEDLIGAHTNHTFTHFLS